MLQPRTGDRRPAPALSHLPPATRRLLELEPDACRWPRGHPAEESFGFCGEPRCGRKPYCARHALLARGDAP